MHSVTPASMSQRDRKATSRDVSFYITSSISGGVFRTLLKTSLLELFLISVIKLYARKNPLQEKTSYVPIKKHVSQTIILKRYFIESGLSMGWHDSLGQKIQPEIHILLGLTFSQISVIQAIFFIRTSKIRWRWTVLNFSSFFRQRRS